MQLGAELATRYLLIMSIRVYPANTLLANKENAENCG